MKTNMLAEIFKHIEKSKINRVHCNHDNTKCLVTVPDGAYIITLNPYMQTKIEDDAIDWDNGVFIDQNLIQEFLKEGSCIYERYINYNN